MSGKLTAKVAIVTGAGRGIGRGIALRLAEEGCSLVINDLDLNGAKDVVRKIKERGRGAIAIRADVSKYPQVKRMVKAAIDRFKRIDILVNNAGITKVLPVTELTEKVWDKVMDINLKGTFLCSKEVAKQMIKQRSGKIINISSKSGKVGGLWLSAYCASKFGVIGFTQSLALELAPYGINVNAVCPGIVFTPLWKSLEKKYAKKLGIPIEKVRPYYVSKIPLGRDGTPEDVANVVIFLASSDSDYMTGQAINVTGGQEMR